MGSSTCKRKTNDRVLYIVCTARCTYPALELISCLILKMKGSVQIRHIVQSAGQNKAVCTRLDLKISKY
jgi:hypothetical protein